MRNKDEWRRRAKAARARLRVEPEQHLDGLASFLTSVDGWVVVYRALGDELDLAPAFDRMGRDRLALTRTPAEGNDLTVHPLDGPTERHRYGFDQPTAEAPVVADVDIGAVLVPGLAFDREGRRLGRGAGYYDRFLARLGPSTLRIGITGGYLVAQLPVDAHDVAMTHLSGAFGVASVPLDPEP
ncbi:MAG: 5-formyltetrahydrofolate cyclo-ligase [Actinomycetota bacterium]